MRLYPHAFTARLAVTAGDALELAFEVVNAGDAPLSFEIALHTYFAVSAADAVAVGGLGGCAYADKVAGGARRQQDGAPIRFEGEVDRVYESGGPVTLADPARARPIQIESAGAGSDDRVEPGAEQDPHDGRHVARRIPRLRLRRDRQRRRPARHAAAGRPPRDPGPLQCGRQMSSEISIPRDSDEERGGRTLRKPSYPISQSLSAYLARFRRELELPVTYARLEGFRDSLPARRRRRARHLVGDGPLPARARWRR